MKDQNNKVEWSDFKIALPIAVAFIVLFIFLQKMGLVNLINTSKVNYGTALFIGLIASVSSCMAVVGGLVLSVSANYIKEGDKIRPQVLFHVGRLVSFFILGGVIGVIGASFQISITVTFILSIIVAAVLILLGLKLLDIFPWAKKILPTIPGFIGKKIHEIKNINHTLTPLLVGVLTFFLPCGFTQSMQIYALSTGSFWTGAIIMFIFALGTLPVLALLSFGSLGIHKKEQVGVFFKTAGIVVIFFGIFNLYNAFNLINLNILNIFKQETVSVSMVVSSNVSNVDGVQIITIQANGGYSPQVTNAKADVSTVIRFVTSNAFDCSRSVRLASLNINKVLPQTGTTDIDIGTQSAGTFRGTCGMGMYSFEIEFKK